MPRAGSAASPSTVHRTHGYRRSTPERSGKYAAKSIIQTGHE